MSNVPHSIGDAPAPARGWIGRLREFAVERLDPKAFLGLHLTVGLILGALGVWTFSELLDGVLDNRLLVRWDMAVDAQIHAHVTAAGLNIFNWVSRIGSPLSMTGIAIVGAIVLLLRHRHIMCIGWSAAFVGGGVLEYILKLLVHRTRPTYGNAYLIGHTYSFPSGHAMMSFIGMTTLLYVLWVYWHPSWPARLASIGAAVAVIVLVGVSRIYLGVHYPSDVAGGWAAGAAWIAVCISGVAFTLNRRRAK